MNSYKWSVVTALSILSALPIAVKSTEYLLDEPTIESNELLAEEAFTTRVWTVEYLGQYRIPSVAQTQHNILLAFAEKRDSQGDQQGNDIVLKRSLDGGRTWGVEEMIHNRNDDSLNNPSAIVTKNNLVALLFNVYPKGYSMKSSISLGSHLIETNVMYSANNGLTWTEPVNISHQVTPAKAYLINSGPSTGFVIKHGSYKGRAVLGAFAKYSAGKDFSDTRALTIYHDELDNYVPAPSGKLTQDEAVELSLGWKIGESSPKSKSNEISLVEYTLQSGDLYYLGRDMKDHRDGGAHYDSSYDGGETWNARNKMLNWFPYRTQSGLWRFEKEDSSVHIVHTTPVGNYSQSKGRTDGRIVATKELTGDGLTWTDATTRRITEKFFSNSSVIEIFDPIFKKQRVGVLYEGNVSLVENKVQYVNFSSIDLEYVLAGEKYSRPKPH